MEKLIRENYKNVIPSHELRRELNKKKLIQLYKLKIQEELQEIENSNYKDIKEFADLAQVIFDLAYLCGHSLCDLEDAIDTKLNSRGGFDNLILTFLDPKNDSNKIYLNQ